MKKVITGFIMVAIITISIVLFDSGENVKMDKALLILDQTHQSIISETCGVITASYLGSLSEIGVKKKRSLQFFVDPRNGDETHVAAEVWIDELNKYVYLDPTFNGYYIQSETQIPLSSYEIREYVKHDDWDKLTWVQNGEPKRDYNITTFYINPLYLFQGMMYNINGFLHHVVDNWSNSITNQKSTIFEDRTIYEIESHDDVSKFKSNKYYNKFTSLFTNSKSIKLKKTYTDFPVSNKYKVLDVEETEEKIIGRITLPNGRFYQAKLPMKVVGEEAVISIVAKDFSAVKGIAETAGTEAFTSGIFDTDTGDVIITIEKNNTELIVDLDEFYIEELVNDFKDKVTIINTP